jgi:hypothetical protein
MLGALEPDATIGGAQKQKVDLRHMTGHDQDLFNLFRPVQLIYSTRHRGSRVLAENLG